MNIPDVRGFHVEPPDPTVLTSRDIGTPRFSDLLARAPQESKDLQVAEMLKKAGHFPDLSLLMVVDAVTAARGDASQPEDDPWGFRDLSAALDGKRERTEPTVLRRTDGRHLLYRGCTNGLHADSGIGKSWIAAVAAAEAVAAGMDVLWIDLEDPCEDLIVERLLDLSVDPEVIAGHFHYVNPSEPATLLTAGRLLAQLNGWPTLVVIDSVGEALGLQGYDEDKDLQVDEWKRLLPHPLERAGHTVLLIDHATKSRDNPLFPSGSKRKRALISGSSWNVEEVTPFDRTHPGKLKLVCAKDRHGNYRRKEVGAWMHVDPTGDRLQIVFEAPVDSDNRPEPNAETIAILQRVVGALKAAGVDGLGVAELRTTIRLKAKGVRNQVIDDCAVYAAQIGAITIAGGGPGVKKVHRFARDLTDADLAELSGGL